ncbi:MAG: aminodeoxychorismate synthase component I, partial [Mycobacterium sp.]
MRIDRLGELGGPPEVLRAIGDATNRLHLPPPAALTGHWFGAAAVIAPSVLIRPVDVADAFA